MSDEPDDAEPDDTGPARTAGDTWSPHDVAAAVQLACLLEASAPKPGNVSPGRDFADVRYEDFLASAAAIGHWFELAGPMPLGWTIRRAVHARSRWIPSNTNLGMVLLLTPLAKAALQPGARDGLRSALRLVLDATTVEDSRETFAAIRLANPGGLGSAETEDVLQPPSLPLLQVMRLAAHRDGIAREYATAYETTFDVGLPALRRARTHGLTWSDAVVETFLTLLAAAPDTHIARRAGEELSRRVSRQAADVLGAGGVRSEAGRRALAEFDGALRDPGHTANPGTTADLTAAAIFLGILDGGWHGAWFTVQM